MVFNPPNVCSGNAKLTFLNIWGTSGRLWGVPAKFGWCQRSCAWVKKCVQKATGAAQHVENTSNKPHVVGHHRPNGNRRSAVGDQFLATKKVKNGPKLGVPEAVREPPKLSKKSKFQSLEESAKTKLLCEMSIQSRLF